MPLPGRDQTFAFENCHDMLLKLEREIARFDVAERNNAIEDLQDLAFNISVTAWHMCDWVFRDLTVEQRKTLGVKSLGDLQNQARAECPALHLLRQAATASKHWTVDLHADDSVRVEVAALPRSPPSHEVHWAINFIHGEERLHARSVFEVAHSYWLHFIFGNQIARGGLHPSEIE